MIAYDIVAFSLSIYSIGFVNIVQMLIDKSANVNAVDDENRSALQYAAEKGNEQFFSIFQGFYKS